MALFETCYRDTLESQIARGRVFITDNTSAGMLCCRPFVKKVHDRLLWLVRVLDCLYHSLAGSDATATGGLKFPGTAAFLWLRKKLTKGVHRTVTEPIGPPPAVRGRFHKAAIVLLLVGAAAPARAAYAPLKVSTLTASQVTAATVTATGLVSASSMSATSLTVNNSTITRLNVGTLVANSITGGVALATVPVFFGYVSADINNVTGDNTAYTIVFDAERVDSASGFNTGTGAYTVQTGDGGYWDISSECGFNMDSSHDSGYARLDIITSNQEYRGRRIIGTADAAANVEASASNTVLSADIEAGDTITARIVVAGVSGGGSKDVDIQGVSGGVTFCWISGHKVRN